MEFLVSACLAGFSAAMSPPCPLCWPPPVADGVTCSWQSVCLSQSSGPVLHHHRGAGLRLGQRVLLLIGFMTPVPLVAHKVTAALVPGAIGYKEQYQLSSQWCEMITH